MSAGKQGVEYEIGAKDETGAAVSSATGKIKSFASTVGGNLMNIKAGFDMVASAARSFLSKIQKAFRFETMTVQFKTLVGSMEEARAHMAMLQEMGDTPPFSMEAFAAASRSMMIMSEGALGFKESLELVGDAAAATGTPLESLAHQVGLAYATIRDGEPITRATMALRNMGVITPECAARLENLQKSGARNSEIWDALTKEIGKYRGAMVETEKTGEGLVGAIQSQWDDAVRTFGGAFLEAAKGGLTLVLEKMKALNADGSVKSWAEKAVGALGKVVAAARKVVDIWEKVKAAVKVPFNAAGAAIGTLMGGGSLKDAGAAWKREWNATKSENAKERQEKEAAKEAAKAKAEAEREAGKDVEKSRAAAERKAAKAAAKIKEDMDRAALERNRRLQKKIAAEIAKKQAEETKKELEKQRNLQSAAQSRLSAAKSEEASAWSDFGKAETVAGRRELRKKERGEDKLERRFQSRLAKLQEKYGDSWREVGGLSISEAAARRLAVARENMDRAKADSVRAADAAENCEKWLELLAKNIDSGGD